MNYEQFSPEAKQAIEHIRKFLVANKQNIEIEECECCTVFIKEGIVKNLFTLIFNSIILFNSSPKEAAEVAEFCKMKHYWLD